MRHFNLARFVLIRAASLVNPWKKVLTSPTRARKFSLFTPLTVPFPQV